MPWLPDFVGAVELVRRQSQSEGQADPVGQYVAALNDGNSSALEDVWPSAVVVYDPRAGEVRGHRQLRQFVKRSRGILADLQARTETVTATVAGDRAVVELVAHLGRDGKQIEWPMAVVAESTDPRSVVFRSYFSQRPLDGKPDVRSPILPPSAERPGDVVDAYQSALLAGDVDAAVGTFAADGYVREAFGPRRVHRGAAELRAYFHACFGSGDAIGLQLCAVTDDGVRCAVEYNCVHIGGHDVPPQAGILVHERGADGLLSAVRMYDDVFPSPGQ